MNYICKNLLFHYLSLPTVMVVGNATMRMGPSDYISPYLHNDMSLAAADAVGKFFAGNDPSIKFIPDSFDNKQGPTTAFSSTVEARRWDYTITSLLALEEIHKSQEFPTALSPIELAQGMKFVTRIHKSNLEPPEESPEHVPGVFSTVEWSESTTSLRMVQRAVKFSMHELQTEKGQQDYKVQLHNLGLMFVRDLHDCILRKFAKQQTAIQALANFLPASNAISMDLVHAGIRNFGALNSSLKGLDVMVANIKLIGTIQDVKFDTIVVPYGSLSKIALDSNHFRLEQIPMTMSKELAKMADLRDAVNLPTYIFDETFNVYQKTRTAMQMQNPESDPLSNEAVFSTYHPFGTDELVTSTSRDIQIIDAASKSLKTITLIQALRCLPTTFFAPHTFGDKLSQHELSSSPETIQYIIANYKPDDYMPLSNEQIEESKRNGLGFQVMNEHHLEIEDYYKLQCFFQERFDLENVIKIIKRGGPFPFNIIAIRPKIIAETGNAIVCKKGRETAITYCLPPWVMVSRDTSIETAGLKVALWRECHIQRPGNIVNFEHAFVNRINKGMGVTPGDRQSYLEDPMNFNADWYPEITGLFTPHFAWEPIIRIVKGQEFLSSSNNFKQVEIVKFNAIFNSIPDYGSRLWNADVLNPGAIPRISCLGTTHQFKVESQNIYKRTIRGELIHNVGHLKELDSVEGMRSLTGLAHNF